MSQNPPSSPRFVPKTTRGRLLALALLLIVFTAAVLAVWNVTGNPTSAAQGREGTRTFEGTPDDLPSAVVPGEAIEVEGTVSRRGDDWTAAVTYVVEGAQREAVMPTVDEAMTADGCTLRQRAYDDETMQVIYDCEDGSVATVTYRTIDEGVGTAVVLVSP